MTQDKVDTACDQFTEALRKAPGITLAKLHNREVFDKAWNLLKQNKLRNKIIPLNRETHFANIFVYSFSRVLLQRLKSLYPVKRLCGRFLRMCAKE